VFTRHKYSILYLKGKIIKDVFLYKIWLFHHFLNRLKYKNEEIVAVATFKEPVATCGKWLQGWTTLI